MFVQDSSSKELGTTRAPSLGSVNKVFIALYCQPKYCTIEGECATLYVW